MLSELINFGQKFTLRETLRDRKTHNWIFPHSLADVFVSVLLQAVIPTWKASVSCLLLSLTAKDREPGTSVSWPHAPGKCIHPQPTLWCQLHSLDLITIFSPTLWATEQNKHIKCTCSVRKEVDDSRLPCVLQITTAFYSKEGKTAERMTLHACNLTVRVCFTPGPLTICVYSKMMISKITKKIRDCQSV